MVRSYAVPKVLDLPSSPFSQQDGAPLHWLIDACRCLDTKGFQHWIGRGRPIDWPSITLYLTPSDFFLCDYMKRFVFSLKMTYLPHMQQNIKGMIVCISTETLEKT